jgi:hypothetical protein
MVENVIVTAPRLRPEKALDNFIIAHAKAVRSRPPHRAVARAASVRWRSACRTQFNQYVQQRIIRVAMTAGAPLATDEPCRTNVVVIATPEPQALLDTIRKSNRVCWAFITGRAPSRSPP